MRAMENRLEGLVSMGLKNLMAKSRSLWPHACEQLLEQNLSFYVGVELVKAGYGVVEEFPVDPRNRIDLVAFNNRSKTLVLLESKRLWRLHGRNDVGNCLRDMRRAEELAQRGLNVWTFGTSGGVAPLRPKRCLGVALASASGRDKKTASRNLAEARKALDPLEKEFGQVSHPDGTYFVLFRIWRIQPAGSSL